MVSRRELMQRFGTAFVLAIALAILRPSIVHAQLPVPRMPMPPQLQPFQPQPIPFDQLNRPSRAPQRGGITASASFDPPILRLMRFGEYRVTISGATTGIDIPDPLPT